MTKKVIGSMFDVRKKEGLEFESRKVVRVIFDVKRRVTGDLASRNKNESVWRLMPKKEVKIRNGMVGVSDVRMNAKRWCVRSKKEKKGIVFDYKKKGRGGI